MGFLQVTVYDAAVGMSVEHTAASRSRTPRAPIRRCARLIQVLISAWLAVRPLLLFVGSMTCFVVAAFRLSTVLGLVVAGLTLLVAEWRATE